MNIPKTRKEREVWQALQSLQADGLRLEDMIGEVIGDRLLQLGYNRGSSTDIYRYKRTFIAAFQSPDKLESVPSTAILSDPITQAAAALKAKITQESQLELKRNQETAQHQYHELLRRYDMERQQHQALQKTYEHTCEQAQQWQQEMLQATMRLEERTLQLEETNKQNVRFERLLNQLREEIDDQKQHLQHNY